MNKLLSVSCALSSDGPIINSVRKFYLALLFEKGKCYFLGLMGASGRQVRMKSWFVQTCLKQMKINQSIATWQVCYMTWAYYFLAVGLCLEISTGLLYYLT